MHTCNTALSIPDLLTLARAARPLPGPAQLVQDPGSQAQALIDLTEAVRNVFSSPGLLISGFSMPQAPHAAYDNAAVNSEGQLNLDLGAIKEVYDSILMVLSPEVVHALQRTVTALLLHICQQEEATASHSRVSALGQAQWLKVCKYSRVVCSCTSIRCLHVSGFPSNCSLHNRKCCRPTVVAIGSETGDVCPDDVCPADAKLHICERNQMHTSTPRTEPLAGWRQWNLDDALQMFTGHSEQRLTGRMYPDTKQRACHLSRFSGFHHAPHSMRWSTVCKRPKLLLFSSRNSTSGAVAFYSPGEVCRC